MLIDLDATAGPAWVIGAGSVGCRKVKTLLLHGFVVQWATGPTLDPQYDDIAQRVRAARGQVWAESYPHPSLDFAGASLVVAATANSTVNSAILAAAHRAGAMAVAVDPRNVGTARFVAQRQLGAHTWAGVTTHGQNPKLSVALVEHLATNLSESWQKQLAAHNPEIP